MSDLVSATGAAARATDVLLRALGGRAVKLRMPVPAMPGDIREQLGIIAPIFQDIELAPVVYRRARANVSNGKGARWELLVSATVVTRAVGSSAYAAASVLFATAYGVISDDELLEIESATAEQLCGAPYVYRLILKGPLAQVT